MRTLRIGTVALAGLVLTLGSSVGAAAQGPVINPVSGHIDVIAFSHGDFDVEDRVFQFRGVPLVGDAVTTDPRFTGEFTAELNWDVLASGGAPMPSWGTLTVDAPIRFLGGPAAGGIVEPGSWSGDVTGMRRDDASPMQLHGLLIGEGAYEGLCATIDIAAAGVSGTGTWLVDGVIHPMPEAG